MPFKCKLFIQKLLHGHHLCTHPNAQDPQSMLILQLQISHGVLGKQLLKGGLRARFSSSFSLERAMARMQPRVERVSNLWGESKQRARRKLRELVRAEACVDERALPPPPATQPHATSSALTSLDRMPALQQLEPAAATSTLVVHSEDAVFGHDGLLRQVLLKSVASLSSTFMQHWNTTEVTGSEHLEAALKRPRGQGLVTVSNHVAAMDDPLVVSALVPPHYFDQPVSLRWTLCATDRCFKYAGLSQLFTAMKVLPVQRGGGLRQHGLAAAESRVAAGDWVHLFPEGTRARSPARMGPIRKGVGRLVAAAAAHAAAQGGPPPLVLPFVHAGMEDVMPVGRLLPCTGQTVRVVVGKPIAMDDLLEAAQAGAWSEDALYTAIADRIQARMHAMHAALHARDTADAALEQQQQQQQQQLQQQEAVEAAGLADTPIQATLPAIPDLLPFPSGPTWRLPPLAPSCAYGLLGGTLLQQAGLHEGLEVLQPGPLGSSSSSSSSGADSRSSSDSCSGRGVCTTWEQLVLSGVHNRDSSLQPSSMRSSGGSMRPGRGVQVQDAEGFRVGLALAWMRSTLEGGEHDRCSRNQHSSSGSGSGSSRSTRSAGAVPGLCQRLSYGFSLPLPPAAALGLP